MSDKPTAVIGINLARPSRVLLPAAAGLLEHAKSIQACADTEANPARKSELAGVADLYVNLAACLGAAVHVALERERSVTAGKAGLN